MDVRSIGCLERFTHRPCREWQASGHKKTDKHLPPDHKNLQIENAPSRRTPHEFQWDSATTFVDSPMAIDHRPTDKSCLPYRFGEDCLRCGRSLPTRAPSSASQPLSTLVLFYNTFCGSATLLCDFTQKVCIFILLLPTGAAHTPETVAILLLIG